MQQPLMCLVSVTIQLLEKKQGPRMCPVSCSPAVKQHMMTMKFGFAIVYTKTSKYVQLEGLLCSVLFPHFMYCVCNYYCTQNVRKYQCTCIANYTEENVIWQLQGCPVAGNTCIMLQIGNDIQLLCKCIYHACSDNIPT